MQGKLIAIFSDSGLRAREVADTLQRYIETQVTTDADLATRLERIQLSPDAIELQTLDENRDKGQGIAISDAGNVPLVRVATPKPQEMPALDVPEADLGMQASHDARLATSRVYDCVRDRDMDANSSATSSGFHPWSVLSEVSMAIISVIAIISLPLHEPELKRFRQLVSPAAHDTDLDPGAEVLPDDELLSEPSGAGPSTQIRDRLLHTESHLTEEFRRHYGLFWDSDGAPTASSSKNVKRQLAIFDRDPPSGCSTGPIGDDLVCFLVQMAYAYKLTAI